MFVIKDLDAGQFVHSYDSILGIVAYTEDVSYAKKFKTPKLADKWIVKYRNMMGQGLNRVRVIRTGE